MIRYSFATIFVAAFLLPFLTGCAGTVTRKNLQDYPVHATQTTQAPDSLRRNRAALDSAYVSFGADNFERAVAILGKVLDRDSVNVRALDLTGQCMSRLNLFQQALVFYNRAMRLDTINPQLPVHAAQACLQAGLAGAAAQYLEDALVRKPDNVFASTELSKLHTQDGDRDGALRILFRALEGDSSNILVNYLLGSNLSGVHRYQEAIKAFNRVLKKSATYLPALREAGAAYLALDSVGAATITFRQALVVLPTDQGIKMNLGSCYFRRREYARAREFFLQIDKPTLRTNALVQAGMSYFFEKHPDSALTLFRIANSLDTTNAPVHFDLGLCFMELKRYKEAIAEFDSAIALSRDALTANAFDRIGTAYSALGRVQQAVQAYERSLTEDSGNDRTYYNLGVLYETKGKNRAKAVEAYRRVIALYKGVDDSSSVYWKAVERMKYLSPDTHQEKKEAWKKKTGDQ